MRIEDIATADHDCPGVHTPPVEISYIVSAYQRTIFLPCCLWSLRAQTNQNLEVILTDNSSSPQIEKIAKDIFPDCLYLKTKGPTCFHSAEEGVTYARGEYICLPSDDSYYVPTFGADMLEAARVHASDFIMCDLVYDPRRGHPGYGISPQRPERCWFDKTGFILRRDKFQPFPNKVADYRPRTIPNSDCADGLFAEKLVADGVKHFELRSCLVVHN